MRTLRCVKKIRNVCSWLCHGQTPRYTMRFFTSTGILLSNIGSYSQEQKMVADWDAIKDSSIPPPESSLKADNHLCEPMSGDKISSHNIHPGIASIDVSVLNGNGQHVPVSPIIRFSDLTNLPKWLEQGLQEMNFPSATAIQGHTIPVLEQGHDLIGLAPTGSGKTVAFAVPALKRFIPSTSGFPTILVLAPTRELVQQTSKVFQKLSCMNVRVCEAYGGAPREIQARRLHGGCDVLVACPGRLRDFLQNGDVSLEHISFIVFDEADRLLDMGFRIQLDEILSYVDTSRRVQTMMWSATWPKAVEDLAHNYLSPDRLTIRAGTAGTGLQVNSNIKQHILFAEQPMERMDILASLIEKGTIDENTAKMMIFVERQTDTENAANLLVRKLGIHARNVGVIHGGIPQRQRDFIMNSFKNNRTRILIATDVASRGLDFPDVTCVVNFIAPKNIDSYCHRIGRTGRAGRLGDSFTFIGRSDGSLAKDLVGYLEKCGMNVPPELVQMAERFSQAEEGRRFRYRGNRHGRDNKKQQWRSKVDVTGDNGW